MLIDGHLVAFELMECARATQCQIYCPVLSLRYRCHQQLKPSVVQQTVAELYHSSTTTVVVVQTTVVTVTQMMHGRAEPKRTPFAAFTRMVVSTRTALEGGVILSAYDTIGTMGSIQVQRGRPKSVFDTMPIAPLFESGCSNHKTNTSDVHIKSLLVEPIPHILSGTICEYEEAFVTEVQNKNTRKSCDSLCSPSPQHHTKCSRVREE